MIFVILPEKPEDTEYQRIQNTGGYHIPEDTNYRNSPEDTERIVIFVILPDNPRILNTRGY